MSTDLTFTSGTGPDGSPVLSAAGEIDMSNAETFSATLAVARQSAGDEPLTVDLTKVEYIDSAGLAVLLPHADHLRLVATTLLAPVLRVAGLDDLTTVLGGP
jgi:anti-sigma B factor antagonist